MVIRGVMEKNKKTELGYSIPGFYMIQLDDNNFFVLDVNISRRGSHIESC